MSLPRELHLWLQSLDLSLPLKHPRRDLSNGYLIAELLSRYHPSCIDLRQYRTGSSTDSKLANFQHLQRALAKAQLDLPRTLLDGLMHAQPGAHLQVLTSLYQQLTGRHLTPIPPPPAPSSASSSTPSFLSATASAVAKARTHASDVMGGLSSALDEHHTVLAVEAALANHDDAQREERKRHSQALRQHMAAQRTQFVAAKADPTPPPPQCTVKLVTVRQSATPAPSLPSSLLPSSRPLPLPRSSPSTLDSCVLNSPHFTYHQTAPPYTELIASLHSLPDAAVAAIIDGIVADGVDSLTANAVVTPKDYYTTLTLLFPLVTHPPATSAAFASAVTLLTAWGQRIRARDAALATALAMDYLLPKLTPLATTQPEKLHTLFPTLLAYGGEGVVPALAGMVSSPPVLLRAVSALLQADPSLADAALAYVDPHVSHSDAVIRALALSLLAPIAATEPSKAWAYWPTLASLPCATQSDWAEAASAVTVACALLTATPDAEAIDAALALLERLLRPTPPFALAVCALPPLAGCLGLHPPLRPLFFSLLSSPTVRAYSLTDALPSSPALPPATLTLLPLFAADLRAVWDPSLICQATLDHAKSSPHHHPPLTMSSVAVEVVACAVADAAAAGWPPSCVAVLPAVLAAVVGGWRGCGGGGGKVGGLVLGVLGEVLRGEVTRGWGLGVMRVGVEGGLGEVGRERLAEVAEWMWGWVEGEEEGEGGVDGDGRRVVREAMRRLVKSWEGKVDAVQWEATGMAALLRRMEEMRGVVQGRGEEEDVLMPHEAERKWEEEEKETVVEFSQ